MKVLGFAVLLTACSFQSSPSGQSPIDSSGQDPVDAAVSDAGKMDAPPVIPPDAPQCFGGGLLKLCLKKPPMGQRTFATSTFDTGTDTNCTEVIAQANGPELCVVTAEKITISGTLTAIGARPLVLLASDTFAIPSGGTLDASSRTAGGGRKGAGAGTGTCSALDHGKNDSGGAGGGAGGSFGSQGGAGGLGDANNSAPPAGSAAGAAAGATQTTPAVLRGGCPGSAGGDGNDTPAATNSGGAGGDGGGAVYVIAATSITITGDVFASGAGGGARTNATGIEEGGGGGGSGGMIGLDAPVLTISGRVAANGGSGGGGGSLVKGGQIGSDGSTTQWNTRPGGGQGDRDRNGDGGDGARGAVINSFDNVTGATSDGGAGGAGGGVGLVWTWGTVNGGAMISPAPVKKPQA